MPLSDRSDRLAKRVALALATQLPARQSRELGIHDFVSHDHPDTSDPVEMAAEAFLYLCSSESARLDCRAPVLTAVLEFLWDEIERWPTEGDLKRLAPLVRQSPFDADEVRRWFHSVFS
jgi:hypothetical protein